MGNTPSTGRKRGRSTKRPKTASKISPDAKRARKERQPDEEEEDLKCLTPVKSESGRPSAGGWKWKPGGSEKLTQSGSRRPPSPAPSTSSSAARRGGNRHKEPPLTVATTGPRCRRNDSTDYYAVEAILKKWIGPSDRSKRDVFYLVHFAGQKKPPLKNADESLWLHPTQMLDCKTLIDEFEASRLKEKPASSRRPVFYYTDDDSEPEVVDQRLVIEASEVNGRSLRKRQDDGGDGKAVVAGNRGKKQDKKGSGQPDRAIGFDRGLQAKEIVGSTHYQQQMLYAVRWNDCDTVDYVVSTLCHEKAPELVIDYLVSKLKAVPSITSAELALK